MVIYKSCHKPMILYLLFSSYRQRGSEGKQEIAEEEKAESGPISILLLCL